MALMLKKILKIFFVLAAAFFIPGFASADFDGQKTTFFVDSSFDKTDRTTLDATLRHTSTNLYFYIEDSWYEKLSTVKKNQINKALVNLGYEFSRNIYPTLTEFYGSERNPGIDSDNKITILFEEMENGARGYFRNMDGYEKGLAPGSNEREMVFLSVDTLQDELLSAYLAHEFTHLITFNQKEVLRDVTEEAWLNEARAEYAVTLLGYNASLDYAYLQRRLETFLVNPSDSLLEWEGTVYDYGVLNLFVHYMVDHYGVDVLSDSLKSSKVGIESINEALKNRGYDKTFEEIYTDWTIAILLNDCDLGEYYCYKNPYLKNIRIVPFNNFLPYSGTSELRLNNILNNWSAHWQKFSGGWGDLKIDFDGSDRTDFEITCIVESDEGYYIGSLDLNSKQEGGIIVEGMGDEIVSVIIIPSIQIEVEDIDNCAKDFYSYNIVASTVEDPEEEDAPSLEDSLPFSIDKPIEQMSRQELLVVIIRLLLFYFS